MIRLNGTIVPLFQMLFKELNICVKQTDIHGLSKK